MPSSLYLIDEPSPFAERSTWEAHLAALRRLPASPDVSAAVVRAERVLAGMSQPSGEQLEREAMDAQELLKIGSEGGSGLGERMSLDEPGAVVVGSTPARRNIKRQRGR